MPAPGRCAGPNAPPAAAPKDARTDPPCPPLRLILATHLCLPCAPTRRGENVVLLGEVDMSREPPAGLQLVGEADIRRAQRAEREADKMKGTLRARFDFLDDL